MARAHAGACFIIFIPVLLLLEWKKIYETSACVIISGMENFLWNKRLWAREYLQGYVLHWVNGSFCVGGGVC